MHSYQSNKFLNNLDGTTGFAKNFVSLRQQNTFLMKPHIVVIIFVNLIIASVVTGVGSYKMTENRIETDMKQALRKTLEVQQNDKITADTIRTYRDFITIDALRDKVYLSMKVVKSRGKQKLEMVGMSDCTMAAIYEMSDQRLSYLFLFMASLWVGTSIPTMRRRKMEQAMSICIPVHLNPQKGGLPERPTNMKTVGGLAYSLDEHLFYDEHHRQVHLTPMQHRLMEMFFAKANHRLEKQEICNALWPKKTDANETLYSLIRRLKPIVEQSGKLRIESDRGRAYYLISN